MNKKELVEAIADRVSLPRKTVHDVLGATLDVITETIAKGE
ncbi:HU family DNA-binding protein, partial [Planktothrix sp.]